MMIFFVVNFIYTICHLIVTLIAFFAASGIENMPCFAVILLSSPVKIVF
jgi:hypothetical protein